MAGDQEIYKLMDDPAHKEAGFRLLMSTYQKDLYWHIRTIVNHHEDTDDVLQNTFIKIYRYFEKFKRDANLFTWMYRIATNEALTHLKKSKRNTTVDIAENVEIEDKYGIDMSGDAIKSKLDRIVNALPEKQKLVFNMRYYQEMPYKQMSDILETSEGALKASYHFAVKKIEAELKA